MKTKTHFKAGKLSANHNETLVRATRPATGLKVKTHLKAGYPPGYSPVVCINCAAVPDSLLESELFDNDRSIGGRQ